MFIDDASNATNDFVRWLHVPPTAATVSSMLQHDAQTWERCLWTSGGLLNLGKCLYYLLIWHFDSDGKASLTPVDSLPPQLRLTSGDSSDLHEVRLFDCTVAHQYLGNWLAADLQMSTAFAQLLDRALAYARCLVASPLSKHETWLAYFACFMPSIVYTFPVSHHCPRKLRKLQSAPTRATLLKLGFNRNISRSVVYGPSRYGGLGLRNWPVEQAIGQLTLLIRHLRASTEEGRLILITLLWWHLVEGATYQLLQRPNIPVLSSDSHLFSSIRGYLASIDGSFFIADLTPFIPLPNRVGDVSIVEAVAALPGVSKSDAERFSRCRLYLAVTHLSKISSADGDSLTREAWTGDRPRHSPRLWPFQPRPSHRCFQIWRRLLATAFLRGKRNWTGRTLRDLSLRRPLGDWTPTSGWLRQRWSTFYSATDDAVYSLASHKYNRHPPIRARHRPVNPTRLFSRSPAEHRLCMPSDSVPIDVTPSPSALTASAKSCRLLPPPSQPPPPVCWDSYVARLPYWEQVLLQGVVFHESLDDCVRLLSAGTPLFLASDGGAVPHRGSFAGLLVTDDTILVSTAGLAFGKDPSSFRSEAYGMLAALMLLHHLVHFSGIHLSHSSVSYYLDCAGLLARVKGSVNSKTTRPRRFLFSEVDVEMQILSAMSMFSMDFDLLHVKSHQDKDAAVEALSWDAMLNVHCDDRASAVLRDGTNSFPTVPFLPASKCSISIGGTTVTHHLPTHLRTISNLTSYRTYLQRRHQWDSDEVFDTISWDLFHRSTLTLSFLKRLFVIKWVNDLLPLLAQQHRFGLSPALACPSACGFPSETRAHLLRCPHPARVLHFKTFWAVFQSLLDTHRVDPCLRLLLSFLFAPYLSSPPPSLGGLAPEYTTLLRRQSEVGSDSIFYGYFVTDWTILQHRHLQSQGLLNRHNQANSGITALIHSIHDFVHSLWLLRNTHLHGDSSHRSPYKHLHLVAQVSELYESAPYMLASDRETLLSEPLSQVITLPTNSLRLFYHYTKPLVEVSIRQASELGASFQSIDSYFPALIPPELFDVICPGATDRLRSLNPP